MSSNELISKEEVASLLHAAGVHPSKRLGQNFLVDRAVLDAIIIEVERATPREILEIGAGMGTVTQKLAGFADRIIAIEVDRRLAKILERAVGKMENVEVVREDILAYDLRHASKSGPVFVVGNIPCRITAPILRHLVENRESICGALLLTQREVAEKIAASPGRNGSALGIFLQAHADIHVIRRVSKASFYPIPEVDSTLWSLSFLRQPRFTADKEKFFTVVRALYGKRRKMIRSALRDLLVVEQVADILGTAGIDPTVRGETLSLEEIDRIARLV